MRVSIETTGVDAVRARMLRLQESAGSISRSIVRTGCAVLASACRNAAPGTIKQEIGFHVETSGKASTGRAGLMRFPRRGQTNGPHGIYIDQGTKYITPRRFLAAALGSSRGRALAAMRRTANLRIQSIATK